MKDSASKCVALDGLLICSSSNGLSFVSLKDGTEFVSLPVGGIKPESLILRGPRIQVETESGIQTFEVESGKLIQPKISSIVSECPGIEI